MRLPAVATVHPLSCWQSRSGHPVFCRRAAGRAIDGRLAGGDKATAPVLLFPGSHTSPPALRLAGPNQSPAEAFHAERSLAVSRS